MPAQFAVSPSGAATYRIPIAVPPGTAGMAPKLALVYSSETGNAVAGYGVSLAGLSAITRCPQTIAQDGATRGVQDDANDRFCLDGQRLIAVKGVYGADGTEYRTEIETFTRVLSHGSVTIGATTEPQWFEAWTKSGLHLEFGNTADSNVTVSALTTGGPTPTIAWALDKISDTAGNYLTVHYADYPADGQFYPTEVDYTGNASASPALTPYSKVTFAYAARTTNSPARYIAGHLSEVTERLATVTTYAGANPVLTYNLGYTNGDYLGSVQECDAANNDCFVPTTFAWQFPTVGPGLAPTPIQITGTDLGDNLWYASSGDVNGDGDDDLLTVTNGGDGFSHLTLRLATGSSANPFGTPQALAITTALRDCSIIANCAEQEMFPVSGAAAEVSVLGDVNGDGRADLILGDGRVALGQANGTFGTPYQAWTPPATTCANTPATQPCSLSAAAFAVAGDVNGDGYADLMYGVVQSDNLTHYYIQYAIPPSTPGGQVDFAPPVPVEVNGVPVTAAPVAVYWYAPGYPAGYVPQPAPLGPCAATLADVDDDGRMDLVTCTGHVYLSGDNKTFTDAGAWGAFITAVNAATGVTTDFPANFLSAGDLDGDGTSDVFSNWQVWGDSGSSISTILYMSSHTDGHVFATAVSANDYQGQLDNIPFGLYSPPSYPTPSAPFQGIVAGNFLGHGVTDAVEFEDEGSPLTSGSGGGVYLLPAQVPSPALVTGITNGMAIHRQITYATFSNSAVYTAEQNAVWPARDLPATTPLEVVSQTSTDDGIGSHFILNYSYTGAKADAHGRGFLGFHQVTVDDPQSGITTVTTYRQTFPYTGLVSEQTRTIVNPQGQTVTLSDVSNGYSDLAIPATPPSSGAPSSTCPSAVCVLYPYLASRLTFRTDLDGTALPATLRLNQTLDWYGNVTSAFFGTADNDDTTTANTYANDPTHWLLGELTERQVTRSIPQPGGTTWAETRTTTFTYDPTTGLLTQKTMEPTDAAHELVTQYTYDTFGNRTQTTVSGGAAGTDAIAPRTTTVAYDAAGEFPVKLTNALGQSETELHDPDFGGLTSLTGPNGLTTTWRYDGFGRKIQETRADGTTTTRTYLACPSSSGSADALCLYPATGATPQLWSANPTAATTGLTAITPAYAVATQTTGDAPVMTVYDALERPVRTVTLSPDGTELVYQDTQYNAEGWVAGKSLPYAAWETQAFSSSFLSLLEYDYENNYQAVFQQFAASYETGASVYATTTAYDALGRSVSVTDPAGHVATIAYHGLTTVATNALNETKTVVRNSLGQTLSVTDAAGNTTYYNYDPLGDLHEVVDPAGHLTETIDDILGHPMLRSDPDAGWSAYTYDPLGELLASDDAKGQTTTYTYDLLGRLIQRAAPDQVSTWVYDTAAHGVGKLAYSYTNAGNGHLFDYDSLGRVITAWVVSPVGDLETNTTYDTAGRVLTRTYPDGFALTNVYNAQGALVEVDPSGHYLGSETSLWKALAWDPEGQVTQEEYGNGVITTHTYDPATLHETALTAGTSNGVMNQTYTYDAVGNVTTRVDALAGTSEAFTYDSLNRLTQDALTKTASCTSSCTTDVNVTYDALGDITDKSDVGAYTYGDPNHVHAVTEAGSNTYSYDADGNLTAGGGRTYTWMAANVPSSVTQNGATTSWTTSWTYDADYNRVTQTEPGKTTLFLNPRIDLGMHYEQVTYTGGRIDQIHILYAGATPIGQYTTTNQSGVPPESTRYFETDPLGSIIAMTDETGAVTDRYAYDPWGKQQVLTSQSSTDTDHGFTGQEELAVGLVQLNGRLYDPVLARFVSVNPLIGNRYDPQAYNGYSYLRNNPLAGTDPSGDSAQMPSTFFNLPLPMYWGGLWGPTALPSASLADQFVNNFVPWNGWSGSDGFTASLLSGGVMNPWGSGILGGGNGWHGWNGAGASFKSGLPGADTFLRPAVPLVNNANAAASQQSFQLLSQAPADRPIQPAGAIGIDHLLGLAVNHGLDAIGCTGEACHTLSAIVMAIITRDPAGTEPALGTTISQGAAEGATANTPLAMGLTDAGLEDFAQARGATIATGENWQTTVLDALNDPNTTVHFNLDQVDVWQGVQRAASGQGGPTDWELLQIQQNPQSWDTLQFWKGGQPVANPFK